MPNSKECYIVDANGTIIDTINDKESYVKLEDGDRVIRRRVIDYLADTREIKYRFVKINTKAWIEVSKKYPIISVLACHLEGGTNEIRFRNGKLVRRKHFAELCGVSESTVKRQLSGMLKDDVIHKVRIDGEIAYVVNPWVCCKTKRVKFSLYEDFKLSAWRGKADDLK